MVNFSTNPVKTVNNVKISMNKYSQRDRYVRDNKNQLVHIVTEMNDICEESQNLK